jgi:hypothetical protein
VNLENACVAVYSFSVAGILLNQIITIAAECPSTSTLMMIVKEQPECIFAMKI